MQARVISLVVLAVLSGVLWRAELEWRWGWMSLEWVRHQHWAVPVGVAAFIGWTLWAARVKRPVVFAAVLCVFAVVADVVAEIGLGLLLVTGPQAMFLRPSLPEGLYWLNFIGPAFGWALIPLAFGGLCRWFGAAVPLNLMLVSAVLFVASWPLAVLVRMPIESRGSADLIHALKSGFVVPFLVLSLGLMLLAPTQSGGMSQR